MPFAPKIVLLLTPRIYGKKRKPLSPPPHLLLFSQGAGVVGGVGVGWSNLMASQVGHHRTAEHDAEPVGDPHHAGGGDGLFEGFEGGDDFFGFGIDDVVGHCGAN